MGHISYPACNGIHNIHPLPEPGNLYALAFGPPKAFHSIYKLELAWSLTLALALDENNSIHFKSWLRNSLNHISTAVAGKRACHN